jgi:hypothetical protein
MRAARAVITIGLLPIALAPAALRAQQTLTVRGRVELALSAIERVPDREALLRVDREVAAVLRDIVLRPSRNALARNRALSVLGLFPGPATERTLRAVIVKERAATSGVARLDLERALASYAQVAGPRAVEGVQPFLAHASLDVRAAAAGALVLARSPRAIGLLETRLREERSPMVRHRIAAALSRLRSGPGL